MAQRQLMGRFTEAIGRPSTWFLIVLFLIITFFQYASQLDHPAFLANLTSNLGLTRYSVERILYLLPIVLASFFFGLRGGVIVSTAALVCMLPRDIIDSPVPEDALVETSAVFLVGNLISYSIESLRKERERRAQLEAAQEELQFQLSVIEADEKRLAALNQTSNIISQSLELTQVLGSAMDCVLDVMGVDAVRIYILDEGCGELILADYRGVSEEFVRNAGRIRVGEGTNGRVAQTGEPLFVEAAYEDDRPARDIVKQEGICSQLTVPLKYKGKVIGTLCVAMRSQRSFLPEEVDLLTAIGNQIGVAIENARLYLQERQFGEQLRASEQRYRQLFENAHDAIWLHDLDGNIIATNRAFVSLSGYSPEELHQLKAVELLSEDSIETAAEVQRKLLEGNVLGSRGKVKLVKKHGEEADIELASSLVFSSGLPMAFQHIARDVTQEKKMQENLRFFVQQITRVQEDERKRIALELHDETIQPLVVHCQKIDEIATGLKGRQGQTKLRLDELHEQTNDIMQGVRRLCQDLRPAVLDRLGLVSGLEWLTNDVADYSGIPTNLKVIGVERRQSNEVELGLFRIAQEALRNVWKHAQATDIDVTLEFTIEKTRVIISDNGKGFAPPQMVGDLPRYGKLGLAGMQERAQLLGGTLTISSEAGKGTTITAELPAYR